MLCSVIACKKEWWNPFEIKLREDNNCPTINIALYCIMLKLMCTKSRGVKLQILKWEINQKIRRFTSNVKWIQNTSNIQSSKLKFLT